MDPKKTTLHYQLPSKNCWTHVVTQPKTNFVYSAQFNAGRFHNGFSNKPQGFTWSLLKWILSRKHASWAVDREQIFARQQALVHEIPQARPNADLNDWKVWFIGHATVLIQIGPFNFLTDPVWAEYAGPKQGFGPRRMCPAGLALEQLPQIHAVLLSHNHYDHMDLATLTWLQKKFAMPIYTGLGNRAYLPKSWNVIELDWWQVAECHGFEIVYTPAQHGSGRGLRDQNLALWGGFCIKLGSQYGFFAGDTAYANHFKEIHSRFGAPRFALLPIGAYEPRELMRYVHMNPQEAFRAHQDLHAQRSIAIHYRTFQLTDEAQDAPERALDDAMKHSSKLMNPFYCIKEGHKLKV
ncbi:MBL fold metallo-hydrolase [Acinetobacter sp. MD2]|uniref:MBL fold metallo-hydrolase n=1 Tax=Acinetobacter sp. MD2 TaxID=2600066 RepID=UPI002D1F1622|nr:MBL fold metallo-hydrolase [Acinetobacter sp. MD2]MEB3767192.1 MBL fold metallo-hydrolase [Acinetobacter sp. MD2]